MAELIICGVDGSEATPRVYETARWLTDRLGARLAVMRATLGEVASQAAGEVCEVIGETPADLRIVKGDPAEVLLDAAGEDDAALLVVGSRGRGALRAALLGSVSHDVAARARCPVVVVPAGARDRSADAADGSIVCGVDGSPHALAAATVAGQLATRLGLRLVIVHARQNVRAAMAYPGARSSTPPVTGQEDSVAALVDDVVARANEAVGVEATDVVEAGPPAEVLEQVAKREDARLIVIAGRGAGGVRAAVLGSVARELAAHAERPVVVLSAAAAPWAERQGPRV
jgi:nucleotide-binding universal stress UspA family protein